MFAGIETVSISFSESKKSRISHSAPWFFGVLSRWAVSFFPIPNFFIGMLPSIFNPILGLPGFAYFMEPRNPG